MENTPQGASAPPKTQPPVNEDTPEAVFVIHPGIGNEIPVDAIACAVSRARAVLCLVQNQLDEGDAPRINDRFVADALWAVSGIIAQIETMILNAWEARHE